MTANRDRHGAERSGSDGGPMLRVRDAALRYVVRGRLFSRGRRGHWALGGVSFDVHPGETLAVVGRNGAGKSTLLRLLAGILAPDRGQVLARPGLRRSMLGLQVGFIPQLTGTENAILSGMLLGLRRAEVNARLEAIVEFAGLAHAMHEPISSWSDGMRARLGFAVAWHADPELLLLDEALGTGDAAFHEKSAAAIRSRLDSGRTAVLVSHDEATVRELADRCVWIEDGLVAAEGAVDEVLGAYAEARQRREALAGPAAAR